MSGDTKTNQPQPVDGKAKDLSKEPPRSPRLRIGGYAILARMADKGRAFLNGTAGEYKFACPVDQTLFEFTGVTSDEVYQLLNRGASDEDLAKWLDTHGTKRSAAEVKPWSDSVEASRPHEDPEAREWFAGECAKLGLKPEKTTLFDYLEADDRASFKR